MKNAKLRRELKQSVYVHDRRGFLWLAQGILPIFAKEQERKLVQLDDAMEQNGESLILRWRWVSMSWVS
jgi:hypothetical protein